MCAPKLPDFAKTTVLCSHNCESLDATLFLDMLVKGMLAIRTAKLNVELNILNLTLRQFAELERSTVGQFLYQIL